MRRRLTGLLMWSNSSHESRLSIVLFVAWVALPILAIATTQPGHSISPAIGVMGISVQVLFFGAIFVGLLRRSIQEPHARHFARVLALLGVPVNLLLVFSPGSPMVALALVGLLAGALAFRYEGVAGALLLGYVVYLVAESRAGLGVVWGSSSFSLPGLLEALFFFGLPPLGVGTLLLTLWWRARLHSPAGRPVIT